ncbi:MAG TPA: TRAM domain-containing protein [Firmicutes bacterium]|jgi:uncharacterized protein YacL|nr:TRAM domain-containing protein [Bacillota bacterium]
MFFKLLTFFAVFFGGILSSWLVFTYLPFLGIIVKLGIVLAGIIGGYFSGRFILGNCWPRWEQQFHNASIPELLTGAAGILFGLLVSGLVLFSLPMGKLPELPGTLLTLMVVLTTTGMVVKIFWAKREEIYSFFGLRGECFEPACIKENRGGNRPAYKLLDTSAVIDGRIADICRTGFLEGNLIVPGFVLAELQKIADSSDSLKRNRGRRGLDILNKMQKEPNISIRIYDKDFEELADVDIKIVRLAKLMEARVITNDFNLNKVAELYGVPVLNINELANAIKPVALPGEEILVHVIKDGKEHGQGIAYLEDGTMIVVDGGRRYIGEEIHVTVTSVLQTAAGRMIFAKPKEEFIAKTALS